MPTATSGDRRAFDRARHPDALVDFAGRFGTGPGRGDVELLLREVSELPEPDTARWGEDSWPTRSGDAERGEHLAMLYKAAATSPYADRERAASGLRSQLRLMARAGGGNLDWTSLTVEGPTEAPGPHGATWYEWRATVTVAGGRDLIREPVDDLGSVVELTHPAALETQPQLAVSRRA